MYLFKIYYLFKYHYKCIIYYYIYLCNFKLLTWRQDFFKLENWKFWKLMEKKKQDYSKVRVMVKYKNFQKIYGFQTISKQFPMDYKWIPKF